MPFVFNNDIQNSSNTHVRKLYPQTQSGISNRRATVGWRNLSNCSNELFFEWKMSALNLNKFSTYMWGCVSNVFNVVMA